MQSLHECWLVDLLSKQCDDKLALVTDEVGKDQDFK